MNILIVEDDDNKRAHIKSYVSEFAPGSDIREAKSLISALRAAREIAPDVVLLDMALPNYDEGGASGNSDILHFGGQEFLRQIKRAKLGCKVIVVSQFEAFGDPPNRKTFSQLMEELEQQFGEMFAGGIYYHASMSDWIDKLSELLAGVERGTIQ